MALESEVEGALVVLVEELESGLWGGTFATHLEQSGMVVSRDSYDNLILTSTQDDSSACSQTRLRDGKNDL